MVLVAQAHAQNRILVLASRADIQALGEPTLPTLASRQLGRHTRLDALLVEAACHTLIVQGLRRPCREYSAHIS